MSGALAIEANEFAQVATEATASIFSDDPYQLLARTARGYHDVNRWIGLHVQRQHVRRWEQR